MVTLKCLIGLRSDSVPDLIIDQVRFSPVGATLEWHSWWPRARCQREDVHNNVFGLLRLRLLGGSSSRRDWKVIRCFITAGPITKLCAHVYRAEMCVLLRNSHFFLWRQN